MRKNRISKSDASDSGAEINLTPLIDVVFVVLIMFILIAPMLELDRVELASAIPGKDKELPIVQETSSVVIHVRSDDTIWLNSKKIREDELVPLLKIAKKQNPKRIPQLFQDKKAHFGAYQTVKNALEMAGYEELDLILQPS